MPNQIFLELIEKGVPVPNREEASQCKILALVSFYDTFSCKKKQYQFPLKRFRTVQGQNRISCNAILIKPFVSEE